MKSVKFILTLALFLLIFTSSYSQSVVNQEEGKVFAEINETIWKPFKEAYEARNLEAFQALHTEDVLRVNERGIRIGEEYWSSIRESFENPQAPPIVIDFSFEERFYSEEVAYEVGYYRVIYTGQDGKEYSSYGRFHVVLKRIEGKWLIAQDFDTDKIGMDLMGEENFAMGDFLDLGGK